MADKYLVIKIFSTFADNPLNYKWSDRLFPYSLKPVNRNYMKKLFAIIAICSICICTSCEPMTDDRSNPVAGTTWECSGIISDKTMQLSSKGAEAWNIVLTKK